MRLFNSISKRFNRNNRKKGDQKHENASIADYDDNNKLLVASMGGKNRRGSNNVAGESLISEEEDSISSFGGASDLNPVEWTLPLVDESSTEPQSMEEEMKRLEVLNSYFVLDSEGEEAFDRITKLGAKLFDVPICLISLIDLGRQWFLSKVGLDYAETARKHALCAHVILNKYKMLVIPDASKDFRFENNPLVTDGIKIRFYAGAALVSPEGYKLGTVCIISPDVRPQGLSSKEQEILHDLAAMTIGSMVARRNRLLKEEYENKFHSLARTFLDATHYLEEAKDNVEKVIAYNSWGVGVDEYERLNAAASILEMQTKMCTAAMRTTLQDTPIPVKCNKAQPDEEGCLDDDLTNTLAIKISTTDIKKLFDNINTVVAHFPRQDIVTVEIEKSVPKVIGCDDLLLFRAVLNMFTQCIGASTAGEACGIRMRRMKKKENDLLVQCLLGAKPITKAAAKALFDNRDSLLAPVASIVRSMGGHYGMYEAKWDPSIPKSPTRSIFWFQVPFERHGSVGKLSRNLVKVHRMPDTADLKKFDTAVDDVAMDPFHKALLDNGCGRLSVH
jgi:hypothetical protein